MTSTPVMDERPRRLRTAVRWMARRPTWGGLVGALAFFALAMSPSLIPRTWVVQGVLAGLSAAIGYGLGTLASSVVQRFISPISPAGRRRAWVALGIVGPVVVLGSVAAGSSWDREVRALMEMPPVTPWSALSVVLLAGAFGTVMVLLSRAVRGAGHLLGSGLARVLPRPVALALAGVLTSALLASVVLGGLLESVFASADAAARVWDGTVQTDVDRPTSPTRSGSQASLVFWEDLGSKGREFTGSGPTTAEIESVVGRPALEPIRIYGGLATAASLDERVDLVLAELDRTEGWDRSTIIVHLPSGNGEVGRINVAAPEYLLAGDVAQVSMQYGYASSFATMLTKPGAGDATATALIDAVGSRVRGLPANRRPRLFVAGESLGSLSVEAAFEDLGDIADQVDGALMIGPTFMNDLREEAIEGRDAGTPVWRPILDDGRTVRFAQEPADLDVPAGTWDGARILYLSNASDPVAWFDPSLLWQRPDFLDAPRGRDVNDHMRWAPVVTFWQVALDLPFASGAPVGHGHRYLENIVDGWAAVLAPTGWTAADTAGVREAVGS
jgi:uncharacterized membrane protein